MYIAFLDLLGTKDLSFKDKDKYFNVVSAFAKVLSDCDINDDCRVYCFSDCAYVQSNNANSIIDFLVQLREKLLKAKIFFTAAICAGDLGARSISNNNFSKQNYNIEGHIFTNPDLSKVYTLQSMLKGIGISIDKDISSKQINKITKENLIKNFYLPSIDRPLKICEFRDVLIIRREDVVDDIETFNKYWHFLLECAIKANLKSSRYGRYYFSIILNILSSIDFSYEQFTDIDAIKNNGYMSFGYDILDYFINAKDDNSFIRNFIGAPYIYLFIINKLYNDNDFKTFQFTREFLKKIVDFHIIDSFLNDVNSIPECLFAYNTYECLLDDYFNIVNMK